jgi:hypothetical protein
VVGGYLAEPVKKYPFMFGPNTIWEQFPYLLPNLVVVIFLLASCVSGFLALEEVHPQFRGRIDLGRQVFARIQSLVRRKWSDQRGRYASISTEEGAIELTYIADPAGEHAQLQSLDRRFAFTKQVMLQILSSTILGFLKIATLAIIPILLATPSQSSNPAGAEKPGTLESILGTNGGYGLDTQSISNVLLTQAVAAIASQMLWVPTIIARQGPLPGYRLALFVLLCLYCMMPFAAGLPNWLALPALLVMLWIYALMNGLSTTCSAIL